MTDTKVFFSRYRIDGSVLYISGQLPIDNNTGKLVDGGIMEQAKRSLDNLQNVLLDNNLSMDSLLKVNIYLKNIADLSYINELYLSYFSREVPSRAAIGVQGLSMDALIEIDGIAKKQ